MDAVKLLIIMAFEILPFIAVGNDGVNSTLVFPGAAVGGKDLAVSLPTVFSPSSAVAVTIKRGGTLLDAEDSVEGIRGAGSTILAQSFGINSALLTTDANLVDGSPWNIMVNLPYDTLITGVKFVQSVQGIYTADNTNQVGLYTLSGSTFTLVASSANNAALFKGTSGAVISEPFTTPYNAQSGIYWIAVLYNVSATTTTPRVLSAAQVLLASSSGLDLPNSVMTYGIQSGGGVNALGATFSTGAATGLGTRPWLALY